MDRIPNPEFGIFFLGIFVGAILGYGLYKAGGNLRSALTVIGAALGGGPILFMKDVQEARWAYPIGLVGGLLVLHAYQARKDALDVRHRKAKRAFAWFDMILVAAVTVGATIWMAW